MLGDALGSVGIIAEVGDRLSMNNMVLTVDGYSNISSYLAYCNLGYLGCSIQLCGQELCVPWYCTLPREANRPI